MLFIVQTGVRKVSNSRQIIIGGLLTFTAIPGRRDEDQKLPCSNQDRRKEKKKLRKKKMS